MDYSEYLNEDKSPMSNSDSIAIRFDRTTKRYGIQTALDGLDLTIARGELFGFLGPNGAGKTTAMKLAAGLVRPTSGSVELAGFDVQREPSLAKQSVGFVPDSPYIYESLTGREFLHFCAGLYQIPHNVAVETVGRLFEQFNIGSWADKRTGEYSHGMKQRVVMAAAFIHNPQVILIDEPMVGLDPAGVKLVKKVLTDFCSRSGTVFLSTHTLPTAEELCTRIGIINHGRLIACGTLDEVRNDGQRLEDAFLSLTSRV